ncbi:MAG: NAD(P)H-binding protein, partial [Ectothiorhodospiraceae bacterium]
MRIIVFGATGDVGRRVVMEALARGHRITAVARSTASLAVTSGHIEPIDADLLAEPHIAPALIDGHDAAISALRPPGGRESLLVDLTRAVVEGAAVSDVPIFVAGGAATLKLADDSGHTVLTAPGLLPDAIRPIAEACAAQVALLEASPHARWNHLLP